MDAAAREAVEALRGAGLRARFHVDGTLEARIRDARRAALIAVIGEREASAGQLRVTDGRDNAQYMLALSDLVTRAVAAHRGRTMLVW